MIARLTTELRLIDILSTDNSPIVELKSDAQRFLYDSVIENYINSYIEADNEEQFKKLFAVYWYRNILRYETLLQKETKILEELNTEKYSTITIERNETETPAIQQTESWTYGKQNTIQYGKHLVINPDITETEQTSGQNNQSNTGSTIDEINTEDTKYNQSTEKQKQQTIKTNNLANTADYTNTTNKTRTGAENHTNSGSDVMTDSGTNSHEYSQSGTRDTHSTNSTTNQTLKYDVDKFKTIISINKIVDLFIDEFYNLFVKIIFVI